MSPTDVISLNALLAAATPFLRITGAGGQRWCRLMEKPKDPRIGPWDFVANFDVLSQSTWRRKGEVVYFVSDAHGALRLVGQSMSKLGGRWKTVPMYEVHTMKPLGRKALFHTSSWPAIEAGLRSTDPPPFTVSALFRDEFEPICRAATSSLADVLLKPETHLYRLSYHVETWVCSLDHSTTRLWNKQKILEAKSGLKGLI